MASIRKLVSGNYQVQIRKVGMAPVTRTFTSKKHARAFSLHIESSTELARALGKAPCLIPGFGAWCDVYMAQYQGRDPSTIGRLVYWRNQFGDLPITKIDEFAVDDGLINLQYKGLTGSTINRYKSTLSAVFIYFIQHPSYKRTGFTNPVRKESVSRFKENQSKNRFLMEEEQSNLLKICRESGWKKLYLLVLLALTTGARKGELLGLTWTNIDFKGRVASLKDTKNGKPRLIPLTPPVIQELMKWRKHEDCLIFEGVVCKHKPYNIKKPWCKALKESKINNCRFHDLRHTAASNLVRAGRSLFEVGILLGHSSPSMTARYSHLAISDTQNMVDKVMGELK